MKYKLKEIPTAVVHCKTRAEYDELMQIYEDAGWKWLSRSKPTKWDAYYTHGEQTCIDINDRFGLASFDYHNLNGNKIISLQEFKKAQGIGVSIEDAISEAYDSISKEAIEAIDLFPKWTIGYEPNYQSILRTDSFFTSQQGAAFISIKKEKKSIMSYIQDIPNRIKKLLSKDLQAMYKIGWIDEDLDLTCEGKDKLMSILQDEYEVKLGALAIKEVKKLEEKK